MKCSALLTHPRASLLLGVLLGRGYIFMYSFNFFWMAKSAFKSIVRDCAFGNRFGLFFLPSPALLPWIGICSIWIPSPVGHLVRMWMPAHMPYLSFLPQTPLYFQRMNKLGLEESTVDFPLLISLFIYFSCIFPHSVLFFPFARSLPLYVHVYIKVWI